MAIQRIEPFLMNLSRMSDETAIEKLCLEELIYLRKEYNVQNLPDDKGVYSGLATYKATISDYRKAIYLVDNNHVARKYFKLSDMDSVNMKYQNGKSSMLNYKNRMHGNIFIIENPLAYIALSKSLLDSSSYIDNILALAALTGRRVNEIGLSDFDTCDYDDIYNTYHLFEDIIDIEALDMIAIYGLSKKQTYLNNKTGSDNGIIPILCDSDIVLNAIKDLRVRRSFLNPDDFHNKTSRELSRKMKKYYSELPGLNTCHDLRKAYVRLAYDAMVNPDVKESDGIQTFAECCLQQKVPDNYMKFSAK